MRKKSDNKSLFLYTSLIFIVAILMILLSFFSQMNLDRNHTEVTGEESHANSIAEKTSQLSDENMILLETTKTLNEQNAELTAKNWELSEKITNLEIQLDNNDLLCEIFNDIQKKDTKSATELFETLDTTNLTIEQQKFYEYLQSKLRK